MQNFDASPRQIVVSAWRYRDLIRALILRDIIGRYRGSLMGVAWSFFNPVLMLVIYTFVFSVIFKANWGTRVNESRVDFAIILFVGIIMHGVFAEVANRAPTLILGNPGYVKRVVFPLEILPWVALGSAVFHALASIAVLLAVQTFVWGIPPWTLVLFPLVAVPLLLTTLGFAWFLAALGVYIRDITHVTAVATMVLMFLSPVFFPISSLPPALQPWFAANPLAYIIEESRNTLLFGRVPDVLPWIAAMAVGALFASAGFAWFQKSRRGFADVV
jgi:lipopolysaccharide transport system permease protein